MRKACITFGLVAVSVFIGYAAVAAATQDSPWYLTVLLIGSITFAALFLVTGLVYLYSLGKKHLNPLDILDDWRCTYWPTERQLNVTLWFDDHSGVTAFATLCKAQFGQESVVLNDRVVLGGPYMGKTGLMSGRSGPIMAEFSKHNIDLGEPNTAIVTARIKPSRGIWATKQESKKVQVNVIKR